MNIGRALEIIRKDKKMRQVDVAAAAGITQKAYSQIENSTRRPHFSTLELLCKAMDICIIDVYLLALEPYDFPESRRDKYNTIYPAIKGLIREVIK